MNLGDLLTARHNGYSKGFQQKFVYDANMRVAYIGFAQSNYATSDPVWTVIAYTYDNSNNPTAIKASPHNSIFDNYAALTYS